MNFLKYDSPLMGVLSKVFDIICLNVLFVIVCVPIITVGAAFCGLYRGCLALCRGEGGAVKAMWKAFRGNFRQATLIWLGEVLALALLVLLALGAAAQSPAALVPLIIVALIYALQFALVFPLQSCFENPVRHTVKNALLLGIRHFTVALLGVAVTLFPILAALLMPGIGAAAAMVWSFGAGAGAYCLYVYAVEKAVFAKYRE